MFFIDEEKEMFNEILSIGEIIEELIKNKGWSDRDLTMWCHLKNDKTPQLLIVEYESIKKINDDLLNKKVNLFLNKYKEKIYSYGYEPTDKDYNNWLTNNYYYHKKLMLYSELQLKIFCHISYIIHTITNIISKKNYNFNIPIKLNSYNIDFNIIDKTKFINKVYALLYNILDKCYSKNIKFYIELDKENAPTIKYYTEYISAYTFFELYKMVKTSQLHTLGNGVFKTCKQCGLLFYNKRERANCCGSEWCKKKRNSQDVKNNYWKNKLS